MDVEDLFYTDPSGRRWFVLIRTGLVPARASVVVKKYQHLYVVDGDERAFFLIPESEAKL